MDLKRVSRKEVKTLFVAAHLFREKFRGREREVISRSELEDHYHNTLAYLNGLNEEGVSYLLKKENRKRLKLYDSLNWFKGEAEFENMGPWPRMYGLNIRYTLGNVPETAEKVIGLLNGTYRIPFSEKAGRKFPGQIRETEFNHDHFPLILVPGGTIRENEYNKWARREEEVSGKRKLLCKIFEHDVDDGNGRAVSWCINGIKKAPVYIGKRS